MKRLIIPFLSLIALPSVVQANINPSVAETCMQASDFKGCVESMTGKNENKFTTNSDYDDALTFYKEGDFLKATKAVKSYLRMNPDSKEGLILSALINAYGWQKFDEAIEDIDYTSNTAELGLIFYANEIGS